MNTRRSLVVSGAVLALALAGMGSYGSWSERGRPEFRTVAVERTDVISTISATGTLNAVVTVQVGSQISGMIKELMADFNAPVKRNQVIARIDPDLFEARVAQARADLQSARAAVLNAQASVVRAEADVANARANVLRADIQLKDALLKRDMRVGLFREGGISREERDTAQANADATAASLDGAAASQRAAEAQSEVARAQLDAAKAQVEQKQAAVDQAQVDLDHTYIRAPVDGMVVSRNVDVGQTVAASLSAPTLFLIAQDLTKMQVETNVDEADVSRVALGQPAGFSVDAHPGLTFRGRVAQIRQAPQTVQNVVTYVVVVAVDNAELRLKPGMTANVRILVDRRENVLAVSNAAFRVHLGQPRTTKTSKRAKADSGSHEQALWVLRDGTPEERIVRTGLTDGRQTEIQTGVAEGEQIIVAANRPGDDIPSGRTKGPGGLSTRL